MDNTKRHILIIDDLQENLELISFCLQGAGYDTHTEQSGQDGLKYLETTLPDLILLDFMMPEMNGDEVTKKIKSIDRLKNIPIIFISSIEDTKEKVKAFNCGAVDYIPKPFVPEELLVRVKTHITISSLQHDLMRTKEMLQSTGELAQVGGWDLNLITKELRWSAVTKIIHEVDQDYVPDLDTAINFYKEGESRDTITKLVDEALKDGTPYTTELQLITGKNNEIWVRAHGNVEYLDGKPVRLHGSFQNITNQKLDKIRITALTEIQNTFIGDSTAEDAFDKMLNSLLELTKSSFGFISEVLYTDGVPSLKTHTISDKNWDEETSTYFAKNIHDSLKISKLESFCNLILETGQAIIKNDSDSDIRKDGTPKGQSIMNSFLGLPFYKNNKMVGIVGLANRVDGYGDAEISNLDPFLATCSTMVKARRDSFKKKFAEKEVAKLADIVSHSSDAIISTDLDLNVISWNQGAENLLGYTSDEMIGQSAAVLRPALKEAEHKGLVLKAQRGNTVTSYETIQVKKDGGLVHVNMSLFPLNGADGNVKGVSSILRDITTQKEAIEMKERFTRNLEIKVSERTAELQRAKVDLAKSLVKEKELGELKSRFVATASHQFRTPLTVIQSNMGVLAMQKSNMAEKLIPSFDKAYGRIKGQISRMTSLMDDVLILGKINAGRIQAKLEPVDLVDLCMEVSNNYNEIQEDGRAIDFNQIGEATMIPLDIKLMEHVVSNLLSNAFKYSPKNTSPKLTIEFLKSKVLLSVKDSGIGIPKHDINHLFEPFYRASNVEEFAGTGLGSTIAKEYVELNGGTISVKSKIKEGSEFIIEFKKS